MLNDLPHYNIDKYSNITDALQSRNAAPTLPMLITFQLNRIDALKVTIPTKELTESAILAAVYRGLRSIESKLSPYLKKEATYYKEIEEIKKYLKKRPDPIEDYYEKLAEWEDVLVSYFGHLNLLPAVDKVWEMPESETL